MPLVFGLLRSIRGLCGLVFGLQILHLISTFLEVIGGGSTSLYVMMLKGIFLVVSGLLFFGLRWIINRLHLKLYGEIHPSLGKKAWML